MNILKKIADKFENAMVAATFAEAGEFETARNIMRKERSPKKKLSKRGRKTFRPAYTR